LINIPEEDKKLLLDLASEKNVSSKLVIELVSKAMDVRYQDKSEISSLNSIDLSLSILIMTYPF
jgi:hypothetical protein